MRWRYLLSPAADGAVNMATDEALLGRARATGEAVLRIYSWSSPTLSLGRNQIAREGYDQAAIAGAGIGVVRRPTGGRAILHHREVTYSVTAPVPDGERLRESYARINRLLLEGLRRIGVTAAVADAHGRAGPPDRNPCFAHPSPGELVVGGRKLVGSAQWREEGAMLQHGSILIENDQPAVVELLLVPSPALPAPATLREALRRTPTTAEVADGMLAALRAHEDPEAEALVLDERLEGQIDHLRRRYLDERWTWRR